jgi:hypothetical protein
MYRCSPAPSTGSWTATATSVIRLAGRLVPSLACSVARQAVGILADLRHNRLVIPWRIADEVRELLCAACVNHACHPSDGAVFRLHQTARIARRRRRAVACPGAEEPADRSTKSVNASAPPSTNDPVSHHPDIRLRGELALSFSPSHSFGSVETH